MRERPGKLWLRVLLPLFALLAPACPARPRAAATDAGAFWVQSPLRACADVGACEARCEGGDAEQCLQAGNSYSTGQGAALDEGRAAPLLARACALGQGSACALAGRLYEFAHGVPSDAARADGLYERGCRLGDLGGCYNAAVLLERGRGTAKDLARAQRLYRQVCESGSPSACAAADRLTPPGPATSG